VGAARFEPAASVISLHQFLRQFGTDCGWHLSARPHDTRGTLVGQSGQNHHSTGPPNTDSARAVRRSIDSEPGLVRPFAARINARLPISGQSSREQPVGDSKASLCSSDMSMSGIKLRMSGSWIFGRLSSYAMCPRASLRMTRLTRSTSTSQISLPDSSTRLLFPNRVASAGVFVRVRLMCRLEISFGFADPQITVSMRQATYCSSNEKLLLQSLQASTTGRLSGNGSSRRIFEGTVVSRFRARVGSPTSHFRYRLQDL
jgi:hypothetical protein